MIHSCRTTSGTMNAEHSYPGFTFLPSVGLIVTGSWNPQNGVSETTLDGATIDTTSVPNLPDVDGQNCLVSVDDNTIISMGGYPSRTKVIQCL